ncbi:MAG TPA: carbohydrate ABC transporter permease [Chloroflexota bacterium]
MTEIGAPAAPTRAGWLASRRARARLQRALVLALILPGALAFLAPFFWMISTSLKDPRLVYLFPPQIIPDPIRWSNYPSALTRLPFHLYFVNTALITATASLGTLVTASLVAFGFARLRFPGRDVWFLVLLSTIMLPGQVTLVPTFIIFRWLGWVDSFYPLIVPYWFGGTAFSIFLLRQFMTTVPLELDDAAKMDGCSFLGIYWRIVLPLIRPALAAVAIFQFLQHWNDFFLPVIYINSRDNWTLALALNALRRQRDGGSFNTDLEILMAATVVVMIAPLAVFFVAQKYFIQGIVFTGVKG